ncbi:glutaminase [Xanthomarina sp. F1114]|uniref:glutaminase n=1 Tax=Xanthomarina sp. F1114 TaxID=2996019 RepID=UPI00225E4ED7|nr:glutaminase [Xanthomarina sp. F1114]MCX7548010.1 glutaminase [Xanthomarina sp. F1114]
MIDYKGVLNTIYQEIIQETDKGEIASYIPELANVDKNTFGIHLQLVSGDAFSVGDSEKKFSIQSISKVLTLALALSHVGSEIWNRIDVEPSGNPFNHLALLEMEKGIPRNPLINSGAIVIADILLSVLEHPKEDFLDFVRELTGDYSIDYNYTVADSEMQTGFNNFAAANLLKSFDNLHNDVSDVLDFYFHQCSLEMSCAQLTRAFYTFADQGNNIKGKTRLKKSQIKRINAIMLTCGFYDEAGEFAFEVGLPGKSGVGGGIVALLPNEFVISVWAPGLNERGNSKLGMEALEKFTTLTNQSIF